jgi:tetratricopeptide (TPR) repeat protein
MQSKECGMKNMKLFKPSKFFFGKEISAEYIVPAIAGCIIAGASFLPCLRNPLGKAISAWNLPVDLGWQVQIGIFNYGVLYLCCACYCFFLAYANWKSGMTKNTRYSLASAGLLCIMPFMLFLLQYLFLDFQVLSLLAQQKNQMTLIQGHYGYKAGSELFPLQSFNIDISTIQGRFQLLIDQLQFGIFVPLISGWLLLDYRSMKRPLAIKRQSINAWMGGVMGIFFLLFLTMLIRAIGWNVCENMAAEAIAQGNYGNSLQWLDRAVFFDPSLDNVAFYHLERGQALHLEYPDQQSNDSHAYTASLLAAQNDYQDAYLQLVPIWQSHKSTSWVVEDLSNVLEHLSETAKPTVVKDLPLNAQNISQQDSAAFPWVQLLIHIDPENIYGRYILGRIDCSLQDYVLCNIQLASTLQLSSDADFQSSVYTYMALSDAGIGNYAQERILLLQAVQLDPNYRNNTARQELSGLR